jgi:hypothetical protein
MSLLAVLGALLSTAAAEPETRLEVSSVIPDSPAANAGILPGDILVSYNGKPTTTRDQLRARQLIVETDSVDVVFTRGLQTLNLRLPKGQLGIFFDEWLPDLTPDPDAKVIPGVVRLGWSTGKENTFMAALEAAMQKLGMDADYAFLCGASGCAFRTQFFDTWCPSSPDPGCGYDAVVPALAACGYGAESHPLASDGKNRPAIVRAIMASIDSGIPALAIDLIEVPEWGVITGYQKQGQEFLCRTYFDSRKNYDLARKFPFVSMTLNRLGNAPVRTESYRIGFQIVEQNLSTEKYGEYYSGLAAFRKWIDRLKDDFTKLDSARFANVMTANYWIYERIISDRKVGVEYLNRVSSALPDLKPRLDSLVALYTREADLLAAAQDKVPGMGMVTKPEQWTQEPKAAQSAALTQALALETQALPIWQELAKTK